MAYAYAYTTNRIEKQEDAENLFYRLEEISIFCKLTTEVKSIQTIDEGQLVEKIEKYSIVQGEASVTTPGKLYEFADLYGVSLAIIKTK